VAVRLWAGYWTASVADSANRLAKKTSLLPLERSSEEEIDQRKHIVELRQDCELWSAPPPSPSPMEPASRFPPPACHRRAVPGDRGRGSCFVAGPAVLEFQDRSDPPWRVRWITSGVGESEV
jgi:hypothetical protein